MAATAPPRDWTDISFPVVECAGTARWIAVLPLAATEQHGPHLPLSTDVLIAQAYLARVRELLAAGYSRDVFSNSAGRNIDRTYRLSGHPDAADRGGAQDLDATR